MSNRSTNTYITDKDEAEKLLERVKKNTKQIIEEIKSQYLEDNDPWVIGFSGGKDSTALLQLVFYALSELSPNELKKEVHILANDTLVENPNIVTFLDNQLKHIELLGKHKLFVHNPSSFHVAKVTPKLEDTFWLNLIGKGYPSPNRWFRWCTERMKINPTSEYILKTVKKYSRVIILLGTRKSESSNRSNSMKQYEIPGMRLRTHTLPNTFVFAPIADMTTNEVWMYLRSIPCPWGVDNHNLLNLYRSASDVMECPLVIDNTTPSCGNSRFGCWTCTVVDLDKSMTHMVANGEDWMKPLLDFRNWLKEIRDEKSRRMKIRRTGQDGVGPFTMETRKEILEKLLMIEESVKMNLISIEELSAIQYQWNYDGNFSYFVSEIYNKIKGKKIMKFEEPLTSRHNEEYEILSEVCKKYQINADHIKELMELEKSYLSLLRRTTIFADIRFKIENFIKISDKIHNIEKNAK
jgi:DNA sulfur modification protein DndC